MICGGFFFFRLPFKRNFWVRHFKMPIHPKHQDVMLQYASIPGKKEGKMSLGKANFPRNEAVPKTRY